jgi:hypothetical protein
MLCYFLDVYAKGHFITLPELEWQTDFGACFTFGFLQWQKLLAFPQFSPGGTQCCRLSWLYLRPPERVVAKELKFPWGDSCVRHRLGWQSHPWLRHHDPFFSQVLARETTPRADCKLCMEDTETLQARRRVTCQPAHLPIPVTARNALVSSNTTLGDIPKRMWHRLLQRHLHTYVYWGTIHNSQVMETAKMPHHWRMD